MNTFGKFVADAREAKGLSQGDVARALGVSAPAIGKIERDETRRPNIWRALVDFLDVDPVGAEKLLPPPSKAGGRRSLLREGVSPTQSGGLFRSQSPRLIPILGHVAAGDSDRLVMMAEPNGMLPAIPSLADVEGAYALYVYGLSMVPRYYPGEVVYVHPRKPLAPSCFCVVQIGKDAPEGAFVKQFKHYHQGRLVLHQFNPDKDIDFDSSDVISVHRIVGSGDD